MQNGSSVLRYSAFRLSLSKVTRRLTSASTFPAPARFAALMSLLCSGTNDLGSAACAKREAGAVKLRWGGGGGGEGVAWELSAPPRTTRTTSARGGRGCAGTPWRPPFGSRLQLEGGKQPSQCNSAEENRHINQTHTGPQPRGRPASRFVHPSRSVDRRRASENN